MIAQYKIIIFKNFNLNVLEINLIKIFMELSELIYYFIKN